VKGLIGRKVGMTSLYNEAGDNLPCTIVEMGPCVITQVKTEASEGYSALQLGFGERKEKNTTNPLLGHFKKANTSPKSKLVEFRNFDVEKELGDILSVEEVFEEGEQVAVTGTSKGKGFQGVVKRHGFGGVGQATHGQHNRQRAPGAIGACSYPAKVFKGMRMGGRTGGNRVTTKNLEVVKIFSEKNLLLIKGAIPGHKGSFVIVKK